MRELHEILALLGIDDPDKLEGIILIVKKMLKNQLITKTDYKIWMKTFQMEKVIISSRKDVDNGVYKEVEERNISSSSVHRNGL